MGTNISSERAYAHIRSAILSGRYRSGSRLPEDMIAAELGLSRTPVRDALRRLQVERLVTVTPYSGARVASWSPTELNEILQMRAMLEGFSARLAAEKRTRAQIESLRALCAALEAEAGHGEPDPERIAADNLAFHRTIALAAGNARLTASLDSLWALPMTERRFGRFSPERLARSLAHHREILAAIEAREADWAEGAMRAHILAARACEAEGAAAGDGAAQRA